MALTVYMSMIFVRKFCDLCIAMSARYIAMIGNKGRGDALNVCRVSPRVGVVTVNLRAFAIGRRKDRGPIRDSLTSVKIV